MSMMIRIVLWGLLCSHISAFLHLHTIQLKYSVSVSALKGEDLEREIEEKSRRNAKGGTGEVAAGALLGGLVGGPFGALFGASMASNFGAKSAMERARKEEMERLGVTDEMLQSARDVGLALDRSLEGLKATRESLQTQQQIARRLGTQSEDLYDKAKTALAMSDDETAKKYLLERNSVQEKLKRVLKQCAEEKLRYEQMESNVSILEEKAMEVNTFLQRTIGAKAVIDSSDLGFSLSREDPLLQKFRDLGID